MKKILFILLFLSKSLIAQEIFIIIHGTWALNTEWPQSEGNFFKIFEDSCSKINAKVIPFFWSGSLKHKKREEAGKNLSKIIESYPEETKINIVAHSHGANVGIIASQKISRKINKFYALGVPVDIKNYMPNLENINFFYNLFSTNDKIQSVLGFYDRIFPSHNRLVNMEITINGKSPVHSQLHSNIIAKWLPLINLETNNCDDIIPPLKINFTEDNYPTCEINVLESLEENQIFDSQKLLEIFKESSSKSLTIFLPIPRMFT